MASAANAGMTCHSSSFVGYEAQVAHADHVLPAATSDPKRLAIYVERVGSIFYYQSNYVTAGARYPTKILSETAMPLNAVVENILYTSAAEARAAKRVTSTIIAENLVLRGDTMIIDGVSKSPAVELAMAQPDSSAR
jgi:hypothetical protein